MRLSLLMLTLAGCGAGDASVLIVFPNPVSQSTVRRLRVEAYSPDTGAAAATERDCTDFANLAREGKDPIGTPVRGDYQCLDPCEPSWLESLELPKVPKGRQIIYVLAYASTEEDATPVLEGCTDRFDTDGGKGDHVDVEIALRLVIPESARLVKSAGDRQVGRAGDQLAVPLQVRVEADSPTGAGGTYVIPGVPVEFTSEVAGFDLIGEAATFSDANGLASIGVQLPNTAGSGMVVALASELEAVGGGDRSTQVFSVSVTDLVTPGAMDTLTAIPGARPIALALGNIGGGGGLDLAVLGCMGNEANCTAGQMAMRPFGGTAIAVIFDVGTNPQTVPINVPGGLGILPAGLVVADVAPPAGRDEVTFANSRRADCQGANCEGAEILILQDNAGSMVPFGPRYTMTGSNAVGLSTFASARSVYRSVAMAAQGRSLNTQQCSRANRCLPILPGNPTQGGCPPGERCECADCNSTNEPGVCVARDKMIDILVTNAGAQAAVNAGGCQAPVVACENINPENSTCECLDTERGNDCTGRDGCNCKVPERIYIGDTDAPVLPFSLVAGPLKSTQEWDIIVPSIGGLELIEAKTGTFMWKTEPIINAPIHAATIIDLDFASEEDNNDPHKADVVWFARDTCLLGSNFSMSCPVWRSLPEGTTPVGCLGVYYTDGQESVFDLRTPLMGGCRRHHLDFLPDGMCTGDFNDDDHVDVAIATRSRNTVYIFSGDGRGGLLDPPDQMSMPGGGVGGPIACGDVDDDGLDDILVSNAENGTVYLLRTSP